MDNEIKLGSIDAKCPNCGNNFAYCPSIAKLKCDNCGTTKEIELTKNEVKKPYNDIDDSKLLNWQNLNKIIKCKSCGSTIPLKNNEISINCPYCNSQNVVLKEHIEGLYPNSIVLFSFDKDVAVVEFVRQAKKKFMAPRKFKKEIPENVVTGFYFPSFSFDADSHSTYKGVLYRHETVGTGKNAHTVTRTFRISGKIDLSHRDVLVESSSKLNQNELEKMLPFRCDEKVDFKPEYLIGYNVEQYNDKFDVVAKRGASIIKDEIRESILSRYSYDGVNSLDIDSKYEKELYAYYMMPVYTFEFEYKDKKYTAYMNGQTGKLGSGLPISKLKVAFSIIGVILAFLIAIILITMSD